MEWRPDSFDAVVAFYVFNHVPPGQFEPTLARLASWLRPGGFFAASLPGGDSTFEEVEDDWLVFRCTSRAS
jgi:SAM-dependent methyltransferase